MKKAINRLAGKGPKANRDPEQEAARALEAARRETAERLGGSRVDPGASPAPSFGSSPGSSPTPRRSLGASSAPRSAPSAQPASAPKEFLGAAPPVAGPGSFGVPPSAGGAATPSDERRSITEMALEDLQRQRQAAAAESPAVVRPARIPEDEFERRRPPAPGESLPGVPPPHIPSEDLRDQALREILERKERLDREYRERQAAAGNGPAGREAPKTPLHGLARKRQAVVRASPPAPAPVAEPQAPRVEPSSTTTTGESVEDALAGIKGVGPVIRKALLERFDSLDAIREADPEDLTEVDGIGPALASRIKTSL